MKRVAFVFPGQGAQYVGMGKEIAANFSVAKETYEEASDYLGYDMAKLCFEGPEEELVKTENTQPAILTTSMALLRVLEQEGRGCEMTAGLSLGEYTSLVLAKVFAFKDAVRIVKNRGKYMQEAVPLGIGTMAAILGLERDTLMNCLKDAGEFGVVEAANFNSPGQIVISGEIKAVNAAVERALEMGARKAMTLPVSAPFHCSLLKPAGERLEMELKKYPILSPQIPVITNVDAKVLAGPESVVPSLVSQVSNGVLWDDSVELMLEQGIEAFVEIGPGKTLTGFIKKIAKKAERKVETFNVEDLASLNKLLAP